MRKRNWMKKVCSVLLCAIMVFGMIPSQSLAAGFPLVQTETNGKITDPATLNNWQTYFPVSGEIHTTYAGGVWSDKSVFATAEDYLDKTEEQEAFSLSMKDAENNFLVALSAMASTKSIKGYSSIPTDTMLVLDMSSSMSGDVYDLAVAANQAVKELLSANYNNRVGIVLYSANGSTKILMELDRYSTTNANGSYLEYYTQSGKGGIKIASGVKDGEGQPVSDQDYYHTGTFTQDGIYVGMKQLLAANTTVEFGLQAGKERMPILVLMTDGDPTRSTDDFTGNGGSKDNLSVESSSNNSMTDFVTQLTAAYAKFRLENKYQEHDLLFYTLGFDVSDSIPVLRPENYTVTDTYWNSFLAGRDVSANGLEVDSNADAYTEFRKKLNSTAQEDLRSNGRNKYRYYVDRYFAAGTAADLTTAFQAIVEEIILQSLYYPTHVEDGSHHNLDGYMEFTDVIGDYMEVKDIKGIQLGSKLYTGAAFTLALESGQMGTKESPTSYGDNFVWSVKERLNIVDTQTAWDLITNAWNSGQLSYTNNQVFSNYVGWYGNLDSTTGKMVYSQWWDGETIDGTKGDYVIKSYGFQGDVKEGLRATDMYYITVQVRTEIATGKTEVHFRVPAALIPLVEYEVTLSGENVAQPSDLTVGGAKAPIRLLFEVGLKDTISSLTVAELAPDADPDNDGIYEFYSNQYELKAHTDEHPKDTDNTSVWFEPSEENERYRFHEDTELKGSAGSYYTERYVYRKNGTTVSAESVSEPASAEAVAAAVNGVVPKGTARLDQARPAVKKSSNVTGTQPHYEHPFLVPASGSTPYYLGAILGNNGKLSVVAAQGIAITKTISSEELAADQVYPFTIAPVSNTALTDGTVYTTYLLANGVVTEGAAVTPENGALTVSLQKNQTLYVVGLPAGTYTVTEADGADYQVESFKVNGVAAANGAQVTVENSRLARVEVTNSKKVNGSLIIGKEVVNGHASHADLAFQFSVRLEGTALTGEYAFTHSALGSGTLTVDQTGRATLQYNQGTAVQTTDILLLKHNETLTVHALPAGTKAVVTELNIPGGFTANDAKQEVTIVAGEEADLDFVNTYRAEASAPANVKLQITKYLEGIHLLGSDEFTFTLEKHVVGENHEVGHQEIGRYALTVTGSPQSTEEIALNLGSYSVPGTYSYRIGEVSGSKKGMLYDSSYAYFDVHVIDNGQGQLVVSDVTAGSDAVVTGDGASGWLVKADFYNTYSVEGAASMLLNIQKSISTNSNAVLSPGGFTFELYNADYANGVFTSSGPAIASAVTNDAGVATIRQTFTAADLQQLPARKYYVVKEVKPENAPAYIGYSAQEYGVITVLENDGGYLKATTTIYNQAGEQIGISTDTVTDPAVAYQYDANTNSITLTATDGESICYYKIGSGGAPTVYQAGIDVTAPVMLYAWTKTAADDGSFISSDEVAAWFDGTSLTTMAVVRTAVDVRFTNTYDPAEATLTLRGSKVLNGRDMQTDETFSFGLYQTDANFGSAALEKTATVSGAKNGEAVEFTFDALTFGAAGTYYYVIKEEIPGTPAGGMTYDAKEYCVTVTVTGEEVGKLQAVATIHYDGHIQPAAFINTYQAQPTETAITVEKTVKYLNSGANIPFAEGTFSFELYEADSNYAVAPGAEPLVTKAVGAAAGDNPVGQAVFELTYDMADAGTHYYVVKEVIPAEAVNGFINGAQYDMSEHKLNVVVADNGDGTMSAAVTSYDDTSNAVVDVENTYQAKPVVVTIPVSKTLVDPENEEGTFTVELYNADGNFNINGSAARTQTFTTNNLTAAFDWDFSYDQVGTHYYVIAEKADDTQPLMRFDKTVYHVTVEVHDNGLGQLTQTTTIQMEDLPTEENAAVHFQNVRKRLVDKTVDVTVEKTFVGNAHTLEGFDFILQQTDSTYTDAIGNPVEGTTNAEGTVNLPLTFAEEDLDKTFYYTVQEAAGTEAHVDYDTVVYRLKAEVTLDAETKEMKLQFTDETDYTVYPNHAKLTLPAEPTGEEDTGAENGITAPFVNAYNLPVTVRFEVEKTVENLGRKKLDPDGFTFVLTEYTDHTYTTEKGRAVTAVSDKNGDASFAPITYGKADVGTYYFTIREEQGRKNHVTYDQTVYRICVEITSTANGLTAVITSDPAGTQVANNLLVRFINQYDYDGFWPFIPSVEPEEPETPDTPVRPEDLPDQPQSPATGDDSHPVLWAAMIAAGALGFVVTAVLSLRRRRHS